MLSPTIIELIYLVCIAHVWVRGTIFLPVRNRGPRLWIMFANCPMCSGFWIGVVGHFVMPASIVYVLGVGAIVGTFALALCGVIRRL